MNTIIEGTVVQVSVPAGQESEGSQLLQKALREFLGLDAEDKLNYSYLLSAGSFSFADTQCLERYRLIWCPEGHFAFKVEASETPSGGVDYVLRPVKVDKAKLKRVGE